MDINPAWLLLPCTCCGAERPVLPFFFSLVLRKWCLNLIPSLKEALVYISINILWRLAVGKQIFLKQVVRVPVQAPCAHSCLADQSTSKCFRSSSKWYQTDGRVCSFSRPMWPDVSTRLRVMLGAARGSPLDILED